MITNHASFTTKKTPGYTWSQLHPQFTELCMDLAIFYQIILFITIKPNGVKKHAS